MFDTGKKSDDKTHPDYVPSMFSFVKSPEKHRAKRLRQVEKYDLVQNMKAKRLRALSTSDKENVNTVEVVEQFIDKGTQTDTLDVSDKGCQTEDSTFQDVVCQTEDVKVESQSIQTEPPPDKVDKGVQETHLPFDQDDMKDDKKVKYYTGITNLGTLLLLLKFLLQGRTVIERSLNHFQQLVMVLMKLRLNLEENDLAYRFNVSQPTISRMFNKWISHMGEKLSPLIRWPERDELRKTLPMSFRTFFSKCVCIIDCTEIFIERPSDLKARCQTWSNYKQHNTVKLLIAITPQGTISFISKAWGGRVSDKYITEHCGILDKLLPGDLVLADRGFTIQDSVGFYCAEVKTPPFTKGKKQLSRSEIDWSREISHVRIHVERVIGLLKQRYKILQHQLPITLLKSVDSCTIDDIITTCAALTNLSDSVVPFE